MTEQLTIDGGSVEVGAIVHAHRRHPDALVAPGLGPDDCILDLHDGYLGEVQTAALVTRGQARSRYAREVGCDFTQVRVTTGWWIPMTRQDAWNSGERDSWADDKAWRLADELGCDIEDGRVQAGSVPPNEPPETWEPDEEGPVWCRGGANSPRAVRVWFCEVR